MIMPAENTNKGKALSHAGGVHDEKSALDFLTGEFPEFHFWTTKDIEKFAGRIFQEAKKSEELGDLEMQKQFGKWYYGLRVLCARNYQEYAEKIEPDCHERYMAHTNSGYGWDRASSQAEFLGWIQASIECRKRALKQWRLALRDGQITKRGIGIPEKAFLFGFRKIRELEAKLG